MSPAVFVWEFFGLFHRLPNGAEFKFPAFIENRFHRFKLGTGHAYKITAVTAQHYGAGKLLFQRIDGVVVSIFFGHGFCVDVFTCHL